MVLIKFLFAPFFWFTQVCCTHFFAYDASISQVNEKINQSLAFIRRSDELLHNVNTGKSTTNIMITAIIIVIIVVLLSLIAIGLLLYCKAKNTPVTLSKDQLSGINNIAFSK